MNSENFTQTPASVANPPILSSGPSNSGSSGNAIPSQAKPALPPLTQPVRFWTSQKIPSLNSILAMPLRKRIKLKKKIQVGILSDLQAFGQGCATKTISPENSTPTPFDTAAGCLKTHLGSAKSKSLKSRFRPKMRKGLTRKFSRLGLGKRKNNHQP